MPHRTIGEDGSVQFSPAAVASLKATSRMALVQRGISAGKREAAGMQGEAAQFAATHVAQVAERLLGGYIARMIGDLATAASQLEAAAAAIEAGRERAGMEGDASGGLLRRRAGILLEASTEAAARLLAGRAHCALGGLVPAQSYLERSLALDPSRWTERLALESLAGVHAAQGRIEEARGMYDAAAPAGDLTDWRQASCRWEAARCMLQHPTLNPTKCKVNAVPREVATMGAFFTMRRHGKEAEARAVSFWGRPETGPEEARREVEMVVGKIRSEDVNGFEIAIEHAEDTGLDKALIKVAADILLTPCPTVVVGTVLSPEERMTIHEDIANGRVIIT